jgi:hypothetical protein
LGIGLTSRLIGTSVAQGSISRLLALSGSDPHLQAAEQGRLARQCLVVGLGLHDGRPQGQRLREPPGIGQEERQVEAGKGVVGLDRQGLPVGGMAAWVSPRSALILAML